MEIEPTSFKVTGRFSCVSPKKLYRWYKEVLSGYDQAEESGEIEEYDLYRGKERLRVPILKPENLGEVMSIDEKYIDQTFYTVLTNQASNKIAALIQSTRSAEVIEALYRMGSKCMTVKVLNRDLSNTYDWVGRQVFMNAQHVGDKFHVLRHAYNALQNIRIEIKNMEAQTVAHHETIHRRSEQKRKRIHEEKYRCDYKMTPFNHKDEIFQNGDTLPQLLARSKYLLYKPHSKWNAQQKQRAEILFQRYPVIQEAYKLIMKFRTWYSAKNIGKKRSTILKSLYAWYKKVEQQNIIHINVFAALVQRHEGSIVNYFAHGTTNAKAEAINSRIQAFIHTNRGVRNIDFFLYRLKLLFS